MNFNKDNIKTVLGTVALVGSAIAAVVDVFDKDRKEKEYKELKATVAKLKAKSEES